MTKRNTVLALVAAGLLTVVAFAPALAVGLDCSPPILIDVQSMARMEIRSRTRRLTRLPDRSGTLRYSAAICTAAALLAMGR